MLSPLVDQPVGRPVYLLRCVCHQTAAGTPRPDPRASQTSTTQASAATAPAVKVVRNADRTGTSAPSAMTTREASTMPVTVAPELVPTLRMSALTPTADPVASRGTSA